MALLAAFQRWMLLLGALMFLVGINGESCYDLQAGELVDNGTDVALEVCLPANADTLNCDSCTHAGGKTSCWKLDSRCIGSVVSESVKIENWGFSEVGQWIQNFDSRGNFRNVQALCQDRYGGLCFRKLSNVALQAPRLPDRLLALLGVILYVTYYS